MATTLTQGSNSGTLRMSSGSSLEGEIRLQISLVSELTRQFSLLDFIPRYVDVLY